MANTSFKYENTQHFPRQLGESYCGAKSCRSTGVINIQKLNLIKYSMLKLQLESYDVKEVGKGGAVFNCMPIEGS